MTDETGPQSADEPDAGSLLGTLRALADEIPRTLSDRVHLLALELRRAGQSLALIVVLVIAAAILATTAWLGLWAGLSVAAVQAGAPWLVVLLVVLAINLGAAFWAVMKAKSLVVHLALPGTMRRLTVNPVTKPADAGLPKHPPTAAVAEATQS